MRDPEEGNTRRLSNAFVQEFLESDEERDDPPGGRDAEGEGPFQTLPDPTWPEWPEAHGIWAPGDRPEHGDRPAFVAAGRPAALYSSIVRPIIGRDPFYWLGRDKWRGGYPLLRDGQPEAWMEIFHPEWALGVSLLEAMGRQPRDVALFLEAIGPTCRRRAGAILLERLERKGGSGG